MKTEGHIRNPKPMIQYSFRGILSILAIMGGFLCLGFLIGKTGVSNTNHTIESMDAKFVLLVHNDDIPADDPMQQVKEYTDWLKSIRAERIASGEHLHPNGWIISKNDNAPVVEAREAFPGKKEVGGYFVFEANNEQEAIRIAETCPHLQYQGTLELRRIY